MSKKAQSISEYAVLIGLVGVAFLGIQTYVKRAYQARLKGAGDFATEVVSADKQYEPYYSWELQDTITEGNTEERYIQGKAEYTSNLSIRRSGSKKTGIDFTQDDEW